MSRPIPSFSDNQAGFAPTPDSTDLPEGVTGRDLWDAFNRAYRDGDERPDPFGAGGSFITLVADGLVIEVYRPSGRPGSTHGLIIHSCDPCSGHMFTLKNGVSVTWEHGLGVHRLRGLLC